MKIANCPSCGAEVEFRVPASVMAVCPYCRSTLIRHDGALENVGRMAELMDDPSLIQLGARGLYRQQPFSVIGRIQLRYPQGLWNEWHLLFDSGRTGWLGEASGQCSISFLTVPKAPLPSKTSVVPGATVMLGAHRFVVTDIEEGHCVAGEGELPFHVSGGFPAASVDLRSGRAFATIDYSEAPPLLFLGEAVEFTDLSWQGLRQAAVAGQTRAQTLRCSSCGSPVSISAAAVQSVACGSCHAILDAKDPNLKTLSRFVARKKIEPMLALGSEGVFADGKFRVIGFMERGVPVQTLATATRAYLEKTRGFKGWTVNYAWREYLLHNPQQGFRWLTEANGHWNWVRPQTMNPTAARDSGGREALLYQGTLYRHFESAPAEVSYVVGEFYWTVKVGERALVSDYIAPPRLLSQEKSDNEISWALAEYLPPTAIQTAFALPKALPAPIGVAANQPWPLAAAYRTSWRVGIGCALLVLLMQFIFVKLALNQEVFSVALDIPPGKGNAAITTETFRLEGRPSNVQIINYAQIDNDWLYLDVTLVNRDSGETFEVSRELDYYHGCDEDGCWTEGSKEDRAMVSAVPAGNYYAVVEAESRPDAVASFADRLVVKRDVPGWLNVLLIIVGLAVFPLFYRWRSSLFERARWAASDHPIYSYSASADNDD